jgi:hypothetical protein
MYCPKCYQKIKDSNKFCTQCGTSLSDLKKIETPEPSGGNFWFGVLSFLEPIVGFIFFGVWWKNRPRRAKVCGINAIVSVALALLSGIGFGITIWEEISKYIVPIRNDAVTIVQYAQDAEFCYDNQTNALIAWKEKKVTVYECATKKVWFTYDFEQTVTAADAYNGVLAVGFSDLSTQTGEVVDGELQMGTGEIILYDLTTMQEIRSFQTKIAVSEMVMTEGKLIYCDGNQWCQIWAYDFNTMQTGKVMNSVYVPALAVNHEDRILYAVERYISSCDFYYISLDTYSSVSHAEFGEYVYNANGVYYDGKNAHAFGCTFDGITGEKISETGLSVTVQDENSLYWRALYHDDFYELWATEDGETVVYDLAKKTIVAKLGVEVEKVYVLNGENLLAVCDDGKVAVIEMGKIV